MLKLVEQLVLENFVTSRRPSQKVKVLKQASCQSRRAAKASRRPSQKVKVLKPDFVKINHGSGNGRRPSQKVKVLKPEPPGG